MEKDKNIFETAAKKLGSGEKKTEPKIKKAAKKALPETPAYNDPEIDAMMKQIHEMNEDLNNQMETISKKSGLSYDDLKKMIGTPTQPVDLEVLKRNEDLKKKVWGVVGEANKPLPKKRENLEGERKAKTLGVRKKWIPMR